MSMQKIILRPGINGQVTPTLNEGGWSSGNQIRMRDGMPEKRGGWLSATAELFAGVCRGMHSWAQLNQQQNVALGTHLRLYILQGGLYYDITPEVASGTLGNNPFTTAVGTPLVAVVSVAHGRMAGDYVIFDGATAVGGLTIDGEYAVTEVIDADNYTITASGNASSTATGGGAAVDYVYLLGIGYADTTPLFGWGGGGWGLGTWGTPRTTPAVTIYPRTWSLDHWGEDLIANPFSLGIYIWTVTGGLTTRAVPVPNAPLYANGIVIGAPERHLIALGAETGGDQDPLLIRWSDTEDYTIWVATATNSAGSFRLASGNFIMAGMRAASQVLVWTDKSLWGMQFVGVPYVYAFKEIGIDAGLISPHAAVAIASQAIWMHHDAFYLYQGGVVRQIPCTLWREVFTNINTAQHFKIYARLNSSYNEVIWYYPSALATENDSYVSYNYIDNTWDMGTIERTAGIDHDVLDQPLACDADGQLYYEEYGHDANGAPLGDYIISGYVDIADGEDFIFVDRMIPDFQDQVGDVELTLYVLTEPNATPTVKGPFTLTPTTRQISCRARGRQIAMKLASVGVGSFWRLGATRYRGQQDGRR